MIHAPFCPVCKKPLETEVSEHSTFPFCSDRCREIDLFRWCDGRYAIVEDVRDEMLEFPESDQPADEEMEY